MTWPERPTQTAETPNVLHELTRGIMFVQRDPLAAEPDTRDIGKREPIER